MNPAPIVLSDRDAGVWREAFDRGDGPCSIRKQVLHGGLSEGVETVEVDNGVFAFTILPTRGMGLWKGRCRGIDLGWQAPVLGPVHPQFVELAARNGLGWLTGFDEWLCRCGLAWNGPPGDDGGFPLTLHGRIANQPAHRLEVQIHADDSLSVSGEVEEGGLFYPRLRLTTTYTTAPGSHRLSIRDVVENRSSRPQELQVLYHLNNGPPLLGNGSQVHVPVDELWPNTPRAAEGIDGWDRFGPPESGFEEQVYLIRPRAGGDGRTLALLHNASRSAGIVLRWSLAELPYFNLWKNTAALDDGYVSGLEPATGFPRFKARERAAGRVVELPRGGSWQAEWTIEILDSAEAIGQVADEIIRLQAASRAQVHREPLA